MTIAGTHPRALSRHPAPGPVGRLLPSRAATSWPDHLDRLGPLPDTSPAQVIGLVDAAGLTGRGGAGFPTARKLAAVDAARRTTRRPAVVVVNCCEGDTTSAKDRVLVDRSPQLVVDGALAAAAAVGADRVVFAAHQGSAGPAALHRALSERPAPAPMVDIAAVPRRYLASEATSLVRLLNTGDARPTGRLTPIWRDGVDHRPTLVANAETLAHLALIARFGAEWFASVGSPAEPGTALLTLGGAVARPGVVEAATDVPIGALLARAGAPPTGWALVGGLGGRWVELHSSAEIPLGPSDLGTGVPRGVGSIVVLPPDTCLLVETARILQHQAAAGARQCGPCMFGLPAIAADLADLVAGDRDALGRLRRRLPIIDGRGGCGHPDGTVALAASALSAVATRQPGHLEWHIGGRTCRPSATVPLGPAPAGSGP